jgi:thioredoxin reductase
MSKDGASWRGRGRTSPEGAPTVRRLLVDRPMPMQQRYEAAVVGGGPAGLSAALVLGRCRRRTLLIDAGGYRNDASGHVHGFLGRDGVAPEELRQIGRREIARYPSVESVSSEVSDILREPDGGFTVRLSDGERLVCRTLLLATGLVDVLPSFPGAAELVGAGLYPCPYCDGFEHRDTRFAIYAPGNARGARFSATLAQWAGERVFYPAEGTPLELGVEAELRAGGVAIDRRAIVGVAREGETIRLALEDGETRGYGAMFFSLGARQRSDLAARLGCEIGDDDGIDVSSKQATCIPGVYVAGDASRDVLKAIVAAGEGASAAVMMNGYLVAHPM